jgi:2-polyprenyl-3-methyl-5-hydroxy-6-metoxy-1,4-benzoquinol methylase
VREWLANQAASGYVLYEPATQRFALPAEHAAVLADETSPAFMAGGFGSAVAVFQILERAEAAFRSGEGVGWHEHDPRLFCGTERFFGPAYRTHLVTSWIPALDGVQAKLARGARVADVGCGHGLTTILMARAFPEAEVTGFDAHACSIATASARAQAAGLPGLTGLTGLTARLRFERATAQEFDGGPYDLVMICDALHDMGDPESAARNVRARLAPGGTLMLVEPMAGDRLEDNLDAVGRAYYGFSTLVCTPGSLAQDGRRGLGAQAGEARLREVLSRAGFSQIRRAAETPVNLVLEARA